MKKSFPWILIVICAALFFCLIVGILYNFSSTSYDEAKTSDMYAFSNGYFTVIKEWDGGVNFPLEQIVYANDTGVMYYVFLGDNSGGITPLYNADGTLQIYEGE